MHRLKKDKPSIVIKGSDVKEAVPHVEATDFKLMPLLRFKDVDHHRWQTIYLAKLKSCTERMADFLDPKKDIELKESKKNCVVEMIDILDDSHSYETLHTEIVLTEAVRMVAANIFRTF